LDITAAVDLIGEFSDPTVAILKHTNPCGVGSDATLIGAWEKAFATDRQAPFGGIIICNRPLDEPLALAIAEIFSEVIIAPDFAPGALDTLRKKKNLRLMRLKAAPAKAIRDVRSVLGGLLVQDHDTPSESVADAKVVTKRAPTPEEIRALEFGWKVVKHVKSNAIVFAGPDRTLGIGAGQMSRVDSVRIAVSPRPRPARPPPSNPAGRCATTKSSKRPTSAVWPWFSPENVISGIKFLRIGRSDALVCPS